MYNFIGKHTMLKRSGALAGLMLLFVIGIYAFSLKLEMLENFKPYYTKAYMLSFVHSLTNKNPSAVASLIDASQPVHAGPSFPFATDELVAASVPVLMYHGIIEEPDGANITLGNFYDQMKTLKAAGWNTIKTQDFIDFVYGRKNLPAKSFLLTFDDSRKDSYYPVDPILKQLDYTAVMYVITDRSLNGESRVSFHLSTAELHKMVESGRWELESHGKIQHNLYQIDDKGTQGHFMPNLLWLPQGNRLENEDEFMPRIVTDLLAAKQDLEKEFGREVKTYAYPFGDFGQNTTNFKNARALVEKAVKPIYDVAFYQVWPAKGDSFNYPNENSFMKKRIDIDVNWTGKDLLDVLNAGRIKHIPYEPTSFGREWVSTWGTVLNGDSLTLSAKENTTGGATFLNGSYPFIDYSFFANVSMNPESHISLVGLRQDNDNYLSCTFTRDTVSIEKWRNGKSTLLAVNHYALRTDFTNLWVGLAAHDNGLDCYIGKDKVTETRAINPIIKHGSIGFKVWSPRNIKSIATIKEVRVRKISTLTDDLAHLPSYTITETAGSGTEHVMSPALPSQAPTEETTHEGFVPENIPATSENLPVAIGLPYVVSNFTSTSPWIAEYGTVSLLNSALHLGTGDNTASFVRLPGGEAWTDYIMETLVDWHKGSSFSLVGRYKDSKNYVTCSFSTYGKSAKVTVVKNGRSNTLGTTPALPITVYDYWKDRSFAMELKGDTISCFVDGINVIHYEIPDFTSGGVGFKTWDADEGYVNLDVKKIRIEPTVN